MGCPHLWLRTRSSWFFVEVGPIGGVSYIASYTSDVVTWLRLAALTANLERSKTAHSAP